MKVVKAYSIDVETAQKIEDFHTDAYGEIGSRSHTVNEAIKWYLGDERVSIAELHEKIKNFEGVIRRRDQELAEARDKLYTTPLGEDVYNLSGNRPWWKKLLGIRS